MKKKTKEIILGVLAAIAAVFVVGFGASAFRKDEGAVELSRWTGFEAGAIEADGGFDKEANTAIVSDMVAVKALKVSVDNEKLSFKIHYYDADGEYLESTASMTADYSAADIVLPTGAEKARVEFFVQDDEEISFTERLSYLKDVKVEYEK